jgi:H+/Cl- antiporter ClcA
MEPIINPMIFYWISVVSNLFFALGFLIFCGIVIILLGIFLFFINRENYSLWDYSEESKNKSLQNMNRWKNICIKTMIITAIISIVMVFTPSKDTMIQMLIAKNITTDNVKLMKGEIKNTVDYIFEKINSNKK